MHMLLNMVTNFSVLAKKCPIGLLQQIASTFILPSNCALIKVFSYAKQKLQSLHPTNIMVQRSPSHLQTGTFYWAHVCYSYFSFALTDAHNESTRNYASSMKRSPLWEALIYALEGDSKYTSSFKILTILDGILLSMS